MAASREARGRGSESEMRETLQELPSKRQYKASPNKTPESSESDAAESSLSTARAKMWQEPQLPSRFASRQTRRPSSVIQPPSSDPYARAYELVRPSVRAVEDYPDESVDRLEYSSDQQLIEHSGHNRLLTEQIQIKTSQLFKSFIAIPLDDYRSCMEFCRQNEAVFDEDTDNLQRLAIASFASDDSDLTNRIVDRLLIIKLCEGKSLRAALKFIDILRYDGVESKDFHDAKERVHNELSGLAAEMKVENQSTRIVAAEENTSSDNHPRQHSDSKPRPTEDQSQSSQALSPQQPNPLSRGTTNMRKSTARLPRNNIGYLDEEYTIQGRPHRFFTVGRVFKTLWHTAAGERTASTTNRRGGNDFEGLYGEPIYSSLRWMLVVAEKKGYCLCCHISTYGNRGLTRLNLREEEIRAHAIVFDERHKAEYLDGEVEMSKGPIALKVEDENDSISKASRIHFGKVHTVEWNVKVKPVGRVIEEHIPRMINYFQRELMR